MSAITAMACFARHPPCPPPLIPIHPNPSRPHPFPSHRDQLRHPNPSKPLSDLSSRDAGEGSAFCSGFPITSSNRSLPVSAFIRVPPCEPAVSIFGFSDLPIAGSPDRPILTHFWFFPIIRSP